MQEMSFEQALIFLLVGAILGSSGMILAGRQAAKKKGLSMDDLEAFLRERRIFKALESLKLEKENHFEKESADE